MGEKEIINLLLLIMMVLYLIPIFFIFLIGIWKTYKKMCGKGWVMLIPIYGTYVLNTKIQKRTPWLVLIEIISVLNTVSIYIIDEEGIIYWIIGLIELLYNIMLVNGISKGFKRSKWFTCGLMLMPFIFYPILGFSKDEFYKEVFEKNIEK